MRRTGSLGLTIVLLAAILSLVVGCAQSAAPSPTAAPPKAAPQPTAAPAVPVAPTAAAQPAAAPTTAPAAAPAAKPAAPGPNVIKIGAILPMTGAGAMYGKWMSQGAALAVEEINAKGGFDGAKLELIIEDHKSGQPKEGATAMNKLADLDKVPFVLTSYSSVSLAAQAIAAEKKVLMINGGGFSPDLIGKPYLYNNRVVGTFLGQAAAEYAFNDLGKRKMAMLHSSAAEGVGTANYVKGVWAKLGGTVVADETHELGATEFSTQLAKIKQAAPDVLATWTFGKDLGFAVKQARELGMTMPILGIDWTPDGQNIAGATMNGMTVVLDQFDPQSQDAVTQQFVKAYKAKYNEDPEMFGANYYEDVYVFLELLKLAKAKGGNWYSGEAVNQALLAQRKFPSVYGGQLVFKEDGTSTKPVTIFEVKDQKTAKVKVMTFE